VVVHAGKILSTFYQCGEGYRLDPQSLEEPRRRGLGPGRRASRRHPKVDEATGELLFFNYSKQAPYMHYGVVGADNRLKHYVPIPLPGPRLPHDMAFTKSYSIFDDLPLFWDPELLPEGLSRGAASTATCRPGLRSSPATAARRTSAGSRPSPATCCTG
jgi:carotenoid cleavage dioxygenase